MNRQDQRLEQLLRSIKMDQPSIDFAEDVMQMIDDDTFAIDRTTITTHLKNERAPMHMTTEVMSSIAQHTQRKERLLRRTELFAFAGLVVLTLILSFIFSNDSSTLFDITPWTERYITIAKDIPWTYFLGLTLGAGLFIMDHYMRERLIA